MIREVLPLPSPSPGTRRELVVYRFGRPGGRSAYLQASLHADELPGAVALHHLARRLAEADAAGLVTGEVVMVPCANPIGLSQVVAGLHLGRYDAAGLVNFNRQYPKLADAVAARVAGHLGGDAAANVARIRAAMADVLAEHAPVAEVDVLRGHLFRLAVGADIALDLHCDGESVVHLYVGTPTLDAARPLADELGARVTLYEEASGGEPFDEAVAGPWWALADRFPAHPIPPACFAATVELRGETDVDDTYGRADADALFRYLQREGIVGGDPGPAPPPAPAPTPLAGVEMIRSPMAGVVVWRREPGERVEAGEVLGEVFDPTDPFAERAPLRATVAGVIYGRIPLHLVRPGQIVVKVAGAVAFRTGHLLTD